MALGRASALLLRPDSRSMSNDSSLRLIIFDLDGTLIDSAPDIVDTTNSLMRSRGRPELPADTIVAAIGEGLKALVFSCFPEARGNRDALESIDQEFYELYRQNLVRRTEVFDGVHEFLTETLGENPTYRVGIVTNKYIDLARISLERLELHEYPWVQVFGSDSLSERKPHPLPLLEMMRLAGVTAEQTVMVGDGLPDMEAAKRAGVKAIACQYGYCAVDRLREAGAVETISSPFELPDVLRRVF